MTPKPLIKVSDKHLLSICSVHTRPHSSNLDTERSASWGSVQAEKTNHGEEVKTAPGEHQVCRGGHRSCREAALRQTERELCGFQHKRGMFQVQGTAKVLRPGLGRGSAESSLGSDQPDHAHWLPRVQPVSDPGGVGALGTGVM